MDNFAASNPSPTTTMDASTYIAEQIPLLQSLHAQLSLPPSALADDTARIDAAVRAAIISVVRSREDEVAEWEAQIADGKRALASLARAVGEQGRCVVYGRRESEADESLPQRHQRLVQQTEQLEQVYNERLAKVEQIIQTIAKLSILLGPPFETPPPLQPVPGSAVPARSARSSLTQPAPTINENLAPTTNKRVSGRKSSAVSTTMAEAKPETWMDVGEEVMTNLEAKVDAALAERDVRLRNLETTFNDLIWYRAELDLPPIAAPSFPDHLRPSTDEEETPGAHARYEGLLGHVMSLNEAPRVDADESQEIQGMEEVEPEIGLMNWSDEMLELWVAEKAARDARIQELFEKIEPLWIRLDVSQDFIDMFTEANRGSGISTISAYEEELERVLEIRRTSLSSFVVGIRKEIAGLQETLLLSEDEIAEFGAFIDDEYTEELLSAHEVEAERLRAEVETKGMHLVRVKEWIQLKADEAELEISAADPNRFKKRGNAMLKEEKMRKRVEKLKPKIEGDLLAHLPAWEEEHGRPFLARGERVIDTIENAIAAKEAAKEAKKLAKLGLGPTSAASGRATPAPRGRSQPSTATARSQSRAKRDAPTPTPGMLQKRQRVGATSGGLSMSMRSSTSTMRTVSSSTAGTMRSISGVSTSSAASRSYATPTAAAAQRRFGAPAAGRTNLPKPDVFKSRPVPPIQPLKPQTLRPGLNAERAPQRRRESFKPRPSMAGGLLCARMDGLAELSGEEEDDVF